MEVFGVPVTGPNIALTLAGLLATLWGGSKVPWKAAISKLLGMFSSAKEQVVEAVSGETSTDPGADFMYAMRDLHRLAHSAEEHQRLGQFTADWWAAQAGMSPKPAETVSTK